MDVEACGSGDTHKINNVLCRPAEEFENNPDVEIMWVIKATEHMEIYFNLLCSVDPRLLKLTPHDDMIYKSFRNEFPEMSIDVLNENELKSDESKEKWRPFCNSFENIVEDFNFGTLVRIDASKDYSKENTLLVPRIQFYAIEVSRNREGLNDSIRKNYQPIKKQKENVTTKCLSVRLKSDLQEFFNHFCKEHQIPIIKVFHLLRKEVGNCERGDFSLFFGKPNNCMKSHLQEVGKILPDVSKNWCLSINKCKFLPPCRLQLFLNRNNTFKSTLIHVNKMKENYGKYKTRLKTILVNIVHEDNATEIQKWTYLRTKLIGQYICTMTNNNRCEVFCATSNNLEKIQINSKEVKYIACTEKCKKDLSEEEIWRRLYESNYLETLKDKDENDLVEQNTVLNAANFLKEHNVPVGCKSYDKNIGFIYIHSEFWKKIFKEIVKLQHILNEHIQEPDLLIHIVPSNKSYFQQQLSISVDILCQKKPKHQTLIIHEPVIFQHSTISIEKYVNQLKEEFEKSLVHKYGEKIIGQQWQMDYLNILSETVLKFELLLPSINVPVRINLIEDGNISVVNKTGTFIQYNYARLCMLFQQYENKVNTDQYPVLPAIENVNFSHLTLDEEWNLLFNYILTFPQVMSSVLEELESNTLKLEMRVHKICHFLINLIKDFSIYYSRVHILTEPKPHLIHIMHARLWLLKGVQQVIYNSFQLFNILPLQKM